MAKLDISDAFGSIDFDNTWKALKAKLGCRRALPLFRLLFGASCNISWCGEVPEDPIDCRQGGRQALWKMPTVRETYVDYTFGRMFDRWQIEGKGVLVGGSPLNAVRHQPPNNTPPLYQAETANSLTHVTWADDLSSGCLL